MRADRVMETSTTTGTGAFSLAGAVTGYRTFNVGIGVGPLVHYVIEAVDANSIPTGEWEVGEGYLSGSSTLVRNKVIASSNSNALVNFSAGTKRVFNAWPAYQVQGKGIAVALNLGYGMP
jgi:hypothetical protein